MPGATSRALAPSSNALDTSSFLLLVVMPLLLVARMLRLVMPGATSSALAPSRNALDTSSFLLLVVMPLFLVAIMFLLVYNDRSD